MARSFSSMYRRLMLVSRNDPLMRIGRSQMRVSSSRSSEIKLHLNRVGTESNCNEVGSWALGVCAQDGYRRAAIAQGKGTPRHSHPTPIGPAPAHSRRLFHTRGLFQAPASSPRTSRLSTTSDATPVD